MQVWSQCTLQKTKKHKNARSWSMLCCQGCQLVVRHGTTLLAFIFVCFALFHTSICFIQRPWPSAKRTFRKKRMLGIPVHRTNAKTFRMRSTTPSTQLPEEPFVRHFANLRKGRKRQWIAKVLLDMHPCCGHRTKLKSGVFINSTLWNRLYFS